MKLNYYKYKFVKPNLKNKTFISFCINLLIGILFSFPVFSAQGNIVYFNITKNECNVIENDFGFKNISESTGNSGITFPEDRSNNISKDNLSNKNHTPGNKDNSQKGYSPPGFREQFTIDLTQNTIYTNPFFVNLTYLKDLRTTKMLC